MRHRRNSSCQSHATTKDQINAVLDRVHSWPQDGGVYELSPEGGEDLEAALAEAACGDFAYDTEVAALFARYRG